jgi:4'-phosphopantetheinyl transferase
MRKLGPLTGGEVHLYIVQLESSENNFAQAFSWLSPDEVERADRFRFERHRSAFVLGRAVLRALVASYLRIAPEEASFTYGPKGKPALGAVASPLREAADSFHFNVSNSGDLAAYAFTLDCEIGVDIEHRRRLLEIEGIARRFFAPDEVSELMGLPEGERHEGFFNCWTRKEAYIKAVGDGLSVPLDSFEVTLQPGVAARMIALDGSVAAAQRWTLQAFTPAPDYAGAIAYQDRERPLTVQPLATVDELLGNIPKV